MKPFNTKYFSAIQAGYEAGRAALPRIMARAGSLQPVVVTRESADAAGI